jgi:hypothetical protein
MMRQRSVASVLSVALGLVGCARIVQLLNTPERPPLPLVEAGVSSDARIDSSGAIAGSFVGEGTSRQVHLLSSDPEFIAALVRRWRPDRDRRIDPLDWLKRRGSWAVNPDRVTDSALFSQVMLVGSPDGHTRVRLQSLLLYGPSCEQGGPRAELVVESARTAQVSLRGPVIGSLQYPEVHRPAHDSYRRAAALDPDPVLIDTLVERTGLVLDSILALRLPARELPLSGGYHRLAINSLADEDAADVVPIRLDDGRIRYAVSLRDSRRTARGSAGLGSIVMIWDATLSWRQIVFLPTFLEYGRRGPVRALAGRTAPLYWRRLQPVSGFASQRDYLWMEQVDVTTGAVRWVILEPKGNVIVAAADVEDGC